MQVARTKVRCLLFTYSAACAFVCKLFFQKQRSTARRTQVTAVMITWIANESRGGGTCCVALWHDCSVSTSACNLFLIPPTQESMCCAFIPFCLPGLLQRCCLLRQFRWYRHALTLEREQNRERFQTRGKHWKVPWCLFSYDKLI